MSTSALGQKEYIAALTGLRGLAAVLVALFHFNALHPGFQQMLEIPLFGAFLTFPFTLGHAGVDIFFVLSGFLLTLPFARAQLGMTPNPSLPMYFKRRLLRVFPAYYAQLIIILLVGSWFIAWRPLTDTSLVAHIFMFFNIGWNPVAPIVGVWWTLPVEMGFYLLLPLLVPLMRKGRWLPTLIFGATLSVAYRYWVVVHYGSENSFQIFNAAVQLPGSLTEFLLGASAALLAVRMSKTARPLLSPLKVDLLFIAGIVLAVLWLNFVVLPNGAHYWNGHWSMLVAPMALGLSLALIVLSLYGGSRIGNFLLANRAMYFIGLISYSLYLWHFVVMQQLQRLAGDDYANWSFWLTGPLTAVAVLIVATISYYAIERPFYRIAHRNWLA